MGTRGAGAPEGSGGGGRRRGSPGAGPGRRRQSHQRRGIGPDHGDAGPGELRPGSWAKTLADIGSHLGADERPPCALCRGGRTATRRLHHLTHGVSVWLCEHHGSDDFLRRDAGRVFAARLTRIWAATGSLSSRRAGAMLAHVRQTVRAGGAAELPGSYSWPELRREAERRYAAGEDPNDVIAELRDRSRGGPARPPSVRTMRRWFHDARWLVARDGPWRAIADWFDARADVPDQFLLLPQVMLDVLPWLYPGMIRRGP